MGMSIPIVTGEPKMPPSKRPGARNTERREQEEREDQTVPDIDLADPEQKPAGGLPVKPRSPDNDRRKPLV